MIFSGGTLGLFLGMSILSGVEVFVWVMTSCHTFMKRRMKTLKGAHCPAKNHK